MAALHQLRYIPNKSERNWKLFYFDCSLVMAFRKCYRNEKDCTVKITSEASRGAGAQSVTENLTGCGFDSHSRR